MALSIFSVLLYSSYIDFPYFSMKFSESDIYIYMYNK